MSRVRILDAYGLGQGALDGLREAAAERRLEVECLVWSDPVVERAEGLGLLDEGEEVGDLEPVEVARI